MFVNRWSEKVSPKEDILASEAILNKGNVISYLLSWDYYIIDRINKPVWNCLILLTAHFISF